MKKVAYRLMANKELEIVENSWLYDVDKDFLRKREYVKVAKRFTEEVNKEFGTNYTYQELFGEPEDIGWRYCDKCGEFYWKDDGCYCK